MNMDEARPEYKECHDKIKAEQEAITDKIEECLTAQCNYHMRYLAWQHYGRLSRSERKRDPALDAKYQLLLRTLRRTIRENGNEAIEHLAKHIRRGEALQKLRRIAEEDRA